MKGIIYFKTVEKKPVEPVDFCRRDGAAIGVPPRIGGDERAMRIARHSIHGKRYAMRDAQADSMLYVVIEQKHRSVWQLIQTGEHR